MYVPNRIIKESICTSEEIDKLTAFQETMFYRLIVNCDDYGRMDARVKILASKLFPLRRDIRENQIEDALRALTSAELVILYTVDGKPFLQMKTWEKHQTIRAKTSKYPPPESGVITPASRCKQMQADESRCFRNPIQKESESESKKEMEKIARAREDMPFGLTDEDVHDSLLIDQQIENAAKSIGLQVSEVGMAYGRRLAHEYGLDVLIESIKKAVDVPKWKYVEGICKGSGSKQNEQNDNRGHHSGLQSAGGEKSGKYASLFDDSI